MTADEMINELVACFVPPAKPMIEKMKRLAESIAEDARAAVVQEITEAEGPSTKIGVKHIFDACAKLQIAHSVAHYVPAHEWTCDACGHEFQYTPCPSDDDKIDNALFDCCPMCGMQPGHTIVARGYKQTGKEWYRTLIEKCWNHRRRDDDAIPFGDLGFVYFVRAKAERDRAESRKQDIADKLADLDRTKHYEPRQYKD